MEPDISTVQPSQRPVRIRAGQAILAGDLTVPEDPRGLVIFAHGTGSSRLSPRNRSVARTLVEAQLATLLLDLLSPEEEAQDVHTGHLRFDVDLLGTRLLTATDWARKERGVGLLRVGYFGASTGAGAALVAAGKRPSAVHAVVSRGGRPDLAGDVLELVRAPTLLIVGERDRAILPANEQALGRLRCPAVLEIIPKATHLFEEPGTLRMVADLATRWFETHLAV